MPRGRWIDWSAEELAWIEARRHLSRRELHEQYVAAFGRADISKDTLASLCKRKGWHTGRDGRFEKGSEPWSKGKRLPYNASSARTQFKKGNRPHTYKGPGHEYVRGDGYVILILGEPNKWKPGQPTRPVLKHLHLWEQANGSVPEGHVLKCLDGNKQNTDPSNWEPVAKAMIPRLAGRADRGLLGYDTAPAELKPTLLAIAKLEHKARTVRRAREEE